jgi:hypothetical protein
MGRAITSSALERNLNNWVADGVHQSASLTTRDGVVVLDAPPTNG